MIFKKTYFALSYHSLCSICLYQCSESNNWTGTGWNYRWIHDPLLERGKQLFGLHV